ncbi:MAG: Glycosyltransferase [Candidatus Magasanikbacteria bacterium GW2011_GWC2_41_17]|uniref:Glycosyltransferase n=2 Tax=Candidatus Magasanikiibacteriota TaxID=1752731 RepID=A0A0G0WNM9_9BACT|nr:MAG: Glycosyltransferase [Candidatus Magasanikbacteria bacterium GW2011_GWC2_41_17]KKS13672.1 MAG: Glycosyltransferase [Candidatus Magasanikbacteria bacterium GW2011_GWA2_41_55]
MKLLIVTQKLDVNDDNLGFFNDWLNKLATEADLSVISNHVGCHNLPPNVAVYSLGKEKGIGRILKFLTYQYLLWKMLPQVDGVFFHMCPEYVLGAWFLPLIFRKRSLLWYAHKSTSFKLRLASWLVEKIFTPSRESCRLFPSAKIEITGHGIDANKFIPKSSQVFDTRKIYHIVSVGRISPVKNVHILIEVAEVLRKSFFCFDLKIVGAPITEVDKKYWNELHNLRLKKKLEDKVFFEGSIANKDTVPFYQGGDIFINLSDTGSIDKAILEAMSCGLDILTSNEAFYNILPPENIINKYPRAIAEKIIGLFRAKSNEKNFNFREYVVNNHSLDNLVDKIIKFYCK